MKPNPSLGMLGPGDRRRGVRPDTPIPATLRYSRISNWKGLRSTSRNSKTVENGRECLVNIWQTLSIEGEWTFIDDCLIVNLLSRARARILRNLESSSGWSVDLYTIATQRDTNVIWIGVRVRKILCKNLQFYHEISTGGRDNELQLACRAWHLY